MPTCAANQPHGCRAARPPGRTNAHACAPRGFAHPDAVGTVCALAVDCAMRRPTVRPLVIAAWVVVISASPLTRAQACPDAPDLVPIPTVQGTGDRSPFVGSAVRIEGVVTASFPGPQTVGGVFVQDILGDDDPTTSDAILVRLRDGKDDAGTTLRPGDLLRVEGTVFERNAMTQIDDVAEAVVCGKLSFPVPATMHLPVASYGSWEAVEGMLVRFRDPPTITEVYDLARYGELTLADGRLFTPGQGIVGETGRNDLRSIVLDDGTFRQNPNPVPFLLDDGRPPRNGDQVVALTAVVLNDGLDSYVLEPVRPVILARVNERTDEPDGVAGELRVAGFNTLNFFTTLGQRGAKQRSAYLLQRDKLVSALVGLDADVVALMEIENDGDRSIGALTAALNARVGGDAYAYVRDPASGMGNDAIKVAVLYRPERVTPVGSASDTSPIHDRPPLAVTLRQRSNGAVFTVIAAHLKSKGGCPATGDTDRGFGCWNLRRSAQAHALLAFADRVAGATQDPDVLVVGDFNSYQAEPPVRLFEDADYDNVARRVPVLERYTFVYFGEAGTLDYGMASRSLSDQVAGATIWHINADESSLLDYDTRFDPPGYARPDPFRSSDHDPILIGLDLR